MIAVDDDHVLELIVVIMHKVVYIPGHLSTAFFQCGGKMFEQTTLSHLSKTLETTTGNRKTNSFVFTRTI